MFLKRNVKHKNFLKKSWPQNGTDPTPNESIGKTGRFDNGDRDENFTKFRDVPTTDKKMI